jgi:hypothetical protein
LHRFPHGWPIKEFLKTYLKNKRAYARKQGFSKESNQKQNGTDNEEEEEPEEDEDAEKGKDKAEEGTGSSMTEDEDIYV